jgi:hypothetical protein
MAKHTPPSEPLQIPGLTRPFEAILPAVLTGISTLADSLASGPVAREEALWEFESALYGTHPMRIWRPDRSRTLCGCPGPRDSCKASTIVVIEPLLEAEPGLGMKSGPGITNGLPLELSLRPTFELEPLLAGSLVTILEADLSADEAPSPLRVTGAVASVQGAHTVAVVGSQTGLHALRRDAQTGVWAARSMPSGGAPVHPATGLLPLDLIRLLNGTLTTSVLAARLPFLHQAVPVAALLTWGGGTALTPGGRSVLERVSEIAWPEAAIDGEPSTDGAASTDGKSPILSETSTGAPQDPLALDEVVLRSAASSGAKVPSPTPDTSMCGAHRVS